MPSAPQRLTDLSLRVELAREQRRKLGRQHTIGDFDDGIRVRPLANTAITATASAERRRTTGALLLGQRQTATVEAAAGEVVTTSVAAAAHSIETSCACAAPTAAARAAATTAARATNASNGTAAQLRGSSLGMRGRKARKIIFFSKSDFKFYVSRALTPDPPRLPTGGVKYGLGVLGLTGSGVVGPL